MNPEARSGKLGLLLLFAAGLVSATASAFARGEEKAAGKVDFFVAGADSVRVRRVPVEESQILDQHSDAGYGARACGPAAVINSILFATGAEREVGGSFLGADPGTRLRYVIDRWFAGRPSSVVKGTKRFANHGCFVGDVAVAYNELLAEHDLPMLSAGFLDRRAGENEDRAYVARIHRYLADSLGRGLPPVVSLRSFVARKHYGESDETRWGIGRHHFVVVTSVPGKLRDTDLGFRFEYIDPNGGRTGSAFVYAEQHLSFRAFRGTNGIGQWLRGTPFLLVIAPSIETLQPLKADWPDRVIITLNHAIFRK